MIKAILLLLLVPNIAQAECKQQYFQDSLDVRHYYIARDDNDNNNEAELYLKELHKYRATHFGRIKGEPRTYPYNTVTVAEQIVESVFLENEIKVHRKVLPALKCVEKAIVDQCQGGFEYRPKWVSSYRSKRSYPRMISNHRFGIAIDFEPMPAGTENGNPCCGILCGKNWRNHRVCEQHDTYADSPILVSKINPCWVQAFEFYGFHWLVNKRMHDTMHFEFLGNPDLVQTAKDPFVYIPGLPMRSRANE